MMKVWDEEIGNKGLKARYEIPSNFIGVHKFVAAIILISIISGIMLLLVFIRQSQERSFQEFVRRGKAGVYQGVTLSPMGSVEGGWIIAGAGDETKAIKERP